MTIARLEKALATRPLYRNLRIIGSFLLLLVAVIAGVTVDGGLAVVIGMTAIVWLIAELVGEARNPWEKRFRPKVMSSRLHIRSEPELREPRLILSLLRGSRDHANLLIDFDWPPNVWMISGKPPIMRAAFDDHLGISGPRMLRAVLGTALCEQLLEWHLHDGVTIREGYFVIPLQKGQTDLRIARRYVGALGALNDRLTDPRAGLTEIIRTDAPQAVAAAWHVLHLRFPDAAQQLVADPDLTPSTRQIGQAILARTHPIDMAADWPLRLAVLRGLASVMSLKDAKQQAISQRLNGFAPADETDALGWAAMLEIVVLRVSGLGPIKIGWRGLAEWLAENGTVRALEWLGDRSEGLRKPARRLAGQIKARLYAERGGQLALDPETGGGALSDARAGETSLPGA